MSTDSAIEAEIVAKGLTAPRVTPAAVDAEITSEHYFTARDGVAAAGGLTMPAPPALKLLTFCVFALRNRLHDLR